MFNQTYEIDHAPLIAGMIAEGQVNNNVSKVNLSAQTVAFGRFVARMGDAGFMPLTNTSVLANIVGVVRYEVNRAFMPDAFVGAPIDRDATIITMGAVAVETITTASNGDPVYVIVGDGTGDLQNVGKVANVIGAGPTLGVLLPDAKFIRSGAAGSIVVISMKVGG